MNTCPQGPKSNFSQKLRSNRGVTCSLCQLKKSPVGHHFRDTCARRLWTYLKISPDKMAQQIGISLEVLRHLGTFGKYYYIYPTMGIKKYREYVKRKLKGFRKEEKRRNPDAVFRELERKVIGGDDSAAIQLAAAWQRAGTGPFDQATQEYMMPINTTIPIDLLGSRYTLAALGCWVELSQMGVVGEMRLKITGLDELGISGIFTVNPPARDDTQTIEFIGTYTKINTEDAEDWYPETEDERLGDYPYRPSLQLTSILGFKDHIDERILRPVVRKFAEEHPEEIKNIGRLAYLRKNVLLEMKDVEKFEKEYAAAHRGLVMAVRVYLEAIQ